MEERPDSPRGAEHRKQVPVEAVARNTPRQHDADEVNNASGFDDVEPANQIRHVHQRPPKNAAMPVSAFTPKISASHRGSPNVMRSNT